MESFVKGEGIQNEKKLSTSVVKYPSSNQISKKDTKKGYLKSTKRSRPSLPKSRPTEPRKTVSSKPSANNKSSASRSLRKPSKIRTSKSALGNAKSNASVREKGSLSKVSVDKTSTKAFDERKDIFPIYKGTVSKIGDESFKLNEQKPIESFSENKGKCLNKADNKTSHSERELNSAIRDLTKLTKLDQTLNQAKIDRPGRTVSNSAIEKEYRKPDSTSGAIPKVWNTIEDKSNVHSERNKKHKRDIQQGENKDVDKHCGDGSESTSTNFPHSFHRERIIDTLKELDQEIDDEAHQSISKKASASRKGKKVVTKKKVLNKDEDLPDGNSDTPLDMPSGTKRMDKYLCSLSGGEVRQATNAGEYLNADAVDVTEKIHASDVNLEANSFPQSSNCPTDNDVSFLLGNAAANNISTSQKSIAERWKQKNITENGVQIKASDEYSGPSNKGEMDSSSYLKENAFIDPHQNNLQESGAKHNADEKVDKINEENEVIEELSCPICYEALHWPQQLDPCRHIFCDPCLRRMADAPRSEAAGCPMCRTEIKSCATNTELMEQIKQIYPNQHKEREKTEKKSGVYDLPLPPTPPKCVNPFLSMQDDEIGASGGGIVMQMPTGQMVVMPLLPSTATVGVIVEMLELAYLTNVLQLLRQRSNNLEELISASRRNNRLENSMFFQGSRPQRRIPEQQQDPFLPSLEFRAPRFGFSRPFQNVNLSERRPRTADPLDFNEFMDEVYRIFP